MLPGVYPAAITPHRRDGHDADFGAMLELVDFLGRGGVQGICLLGPTGEFLNIKYTDRVRLVHLAVKRSRVPVLAGVSHATLDGALELASEAISSGAAGLLLMPPYFFRYEQEEVVEFFTRFSGQVDLRTPILLENLPHFTTPIELDTVRRLMATGRFAGVKDSSGDAAYFECLLAISAEMGFPVFVGNDHGFREARRPGVAGIMSAGAGLVPELYVALERAIAAQATARVDLLTCKVQELVEWLDRFPAPVAVKTAVALRKLKTGPLAVPLSPAKTAMLVEFQRWFPSWLESLKLESLKLETLKNVT